MSRAAVPLTLSEPEEQHLRVLAASTMTMGGVRRALRARILLLAAQGLQNKVIATKIGMSERAVGLWRRRFASERLACFDRSAWSTRRVPITDELISKVWRCTAKLTSSPGGCTSTRVAEMVGISASSVKRIWSRGRRASRRKRAV